VIKVPQPDQTTNESHSIVTYDKSASRKHRKSKKPHLVPKEVVLPTGALFIGSATKGANTGTGKLVFPDDSVYEGNIRKGQPHGQGQKQWPSETGFKKMYRGTWCRGKMDGYGELAINDGEMYIGSFNQGFP
jgi:hypothetical protein